MLPSSASTTSNLAVTGVSGTVENRPARQVKLRNTRVRVADLADGAGCSHRHLVPGSASRSEPRP